MEGRILVISWDGPKKKCILGASRMLTMIPLQPGGTPHPPPQAEQGLASTCYVSCPLQGLEIASAVLAGRGYGVMNGPGSIS